MSKCFLNYSTLQIQAKREFKAREAAARDKEDQWIAATAEQHPPPWDPVARAMRAGGGGDPLRDICGNTISDLRLQRNSNRTSFEALPGSLAGEPE